MFRYAAVLTLSMIASPAWAGCTNYVDESTDDDMPPRAEFCVSSKCENVIIEYTCGNVHGAQTGFSNGWRIDEQAGPVVNNRYTKGETFAYHFGERKDASKITWRELSY